MNAPHHPEGIGASVLRREDERFLIGRGNYVADMQIEGLAHCAMVRSPHARARVRAIDSSAARQSAGVTAVFVGTDMAADGVGSMLTLWQIPGVNGTQLIEPPRWAMARGTVQHIGEIVAVVIAATRDQALDAADLVQVDYEPLPAVVSVQDAVKPDAPQLHPEAPGNLVVNFQRGNAAAVDAAFARAKHVVSVDLVNHRICCAALEPRAVMAQGSTSRGRDGHALTLWSATQVPHHIRKFIAEQLSLPENSVRVIAPDVGGGFGSKIFLYAEETALTWASKQIGRPIKWTADRSEAFLSDAHGRDHATVAEMGLDADNKFVAMRVHTTANLGAYLSTFGSAVPTILYATLLAGQYATPKIYAEVTGVFTNTAPVDAYRGAGRPEATYTVERLVETAAKELGLDPAELRRHNFIRTFPYATPVGLSYDVGDYDATLDAVQALADVAGFAARRAVSEAQGLKRGLGYSCYIEACGLAPSNIAGALGARAGLFEAGEVRVHPTGKVTVFTGSHSHGQGHETTFAQVVAHKLGIPIEDVAIEHGDTAKVLFGMGTYGSRSLSVGGSAIVKALDKVIAKGKKIAAHLLEAADTDIEFEDGVFKVAGTDKSVPFASVSLTAYVPHNYPLETLEPGLNENAFYDPTNFTYPSGSYVCEVEVDPLTGVVRIDRFSAVDDFGNIVNPMIVSGQVHGGIAQGLGQAMMEGCVYDPDSGQLLTGSYMDYVMPRADDLPNFTLDHTVTPCTHNPLGVKGCGEAGAIGSPPAFINALTNALGVRDIAMPATPERVWRAANAIA